jgi:hypothetical protein
MAFRRLRSVSVAQSLGVRVYYPGAVQVVRAFAPHFRLARWVGVGLAVPPSYVGLSNRTVRNLAAIDARVAHWPFLRAMADHRLYVLQRV